MSSASKDSAERSPVTRRASLGAVRTAATRFTGFCVAIMAALLVHDLRNPESSANPDVPIAHPMQLFVDGACHGGLWRSPYSARSVLGFAAVAGMFERNA